MLPRSIPSALAPLALAGLALGMLACSSPGSGTLVPEQGQPEVRMARTVVPPPLALQGSAFEEAARVTLPAIPPANYEGLHNVYRLSDSIVSGSEPVDEEALTQLAAWGIRTVISVDGKAPDVETAQALGLRYVHIPLRYKGIDHDQICQISKSFRELEGPFYVHCFHGRHRGPAAAAIGRVALDGLDRAQAIAEMRQWSATAKKYEGLYSSVATAVIPSYDETLGYEFDFASAKTFGGVREAMVVMTRTFDDVKLVREAGWAPSAEHPDLDPLQTVTQLDQLFRACEGLPLHSGAPDEDYAEMLAEGLAGSAELVELLTDCRAAGAPPAMEQLEAAYDAVATSCTDCHAVYRNR